MKRLLLLLAAVSMLAIAMPAFASDGPHDMDCMECHSTHNVKGDYAIGVKPLYKDKNPARTRTGMYVADIDALCLGCHNEDEGIAPINLHTSHPTGVKPTYTKVPRQLLKGGNFTCVSCHNPHPSNNNYKYLIVPTAKGKSMGIFCAKCHPNQSAKEYVIKAKAVKLNSDGVDGPIVRIPRPGNKVKKKVVTKKKKS